MLAAVVSAFGREFHSVTGGVGTARGRVLAPDGIHVLDGGQVSTFSQEVSTARLANCLVSARAGHLSVMQQFQS